jgi:DNA-binding MarR family transcriptional regulator
MDVDKIPMDEIEKQLDDTWENPVDDRHVGYQLKILDRMFCKQMVRMIKDSGYDGVTMWGCWILEFLALQDNEETYQKDIERKFQTGKSTIAGVMKNLEHNGLIVRKAVEGDARLKQVCLTSEGEAYIEKMKQGREEVEKKVTKGLSPENMKCFFDIVKQMQSNLAD